ncbi:MULTISPECIES: hypothetical protein [unclassified Streptomyces]|uniref:hypothetical protein n=1 Tax=unclassified Streptomyces TaxID=2593676 RepID=UPI0033C986FE
MPFPSSPRVLTGPRRRSLLASAAGAALLVGCSTGSDSGGAGESPSPDERVRARAARDSEELARRYDAVMAAHPALAERLRPLRAQIAAHVEAFGGAAKASPGATAPTAPPSGSTAAPTGSAAPEGSGSPDGSQAPAGAEASGSPAAQQTAKSALAGLAAAERSLSDRRTALLIQVPGELARLLASVAAAGAAHAYLLTEGDK